jgi:hypothetical protein
LTPKFPARNQDITRGDNVLKQTQPAEADKESSGGLKQLCELRGSRFHFGSPVQAVCVPRL